MLHASVRELGWIVGGPRVVLDALLEILTPRGTLMMLASWEGNPYGMAAWPEAQRAAWLAECPPFDPATSPADHREMSILAEYLRTWPGARRSDHPLASFVAVGALAADLTAHHPWQYGHGPDSPLARFCAAGGAVLLLGPLLSNITLLHHAEHLAQIPEKRIDRYAMPVLRDGARVWVDDRGVRYDERDRRFRRGRLFRRDRAGFSGEWARHAWPGRRDGSDALAGRRIGTVCRRVDGVAPAPLSRIDVI